MTDSNGTEQAKRATKIKANQRVARSLTTARASIALKLARLAAANGQRSCEPSDIGHPESDAMIDILRIGVYAASDLGLARGELAARCTLTRDQLDQFLSPSSQREPRIGMVIVMLLALPPDARQVMLAALAETVGLVVSVVDGFDDDPLLVQAAEIAQAVGDLSGAVLAATDETGDGGADIDATERARILRTATAVRTELDQIINACEAQ